MAHLLVERSYLDDAYDVSEVEEEKCLCPVRVGNR
jgi:hypothetical protein